MYERDEETYDPLKDVEQAGRRAAEEIDTEAPTIDSPQPEPSGRPDWARALTSYVPTVKIADGGFSEIWEARQEALGRIVAIKRLRPRVDKVGRPQPISPRHITMFHQEAIVAAHLEHPNILPVYDLDYDAEGLPFLVMKRVRGEPWSEVLARDFGSLPASAFLRKHLPILIAVARAVAYAHAEGIVHRDLKPAQVMIGPFGEVLLMDWGLAVAYPRRVDDPNAPDWLRDPNALINRPLNPAGTPTYMAPEQTEATTHRLGPWTDVYLLGGILYRLLTGQPPHVGPDSSETFKLAQAGVVEEFSRVAPGREIPDELAELAMKALEPEIERRLQSAQDFVRALEEYMVGASKQRESFVLAVRARDRLQAGTLSYDTCAEIINALERALVLWPENAEARKWHESALERYARLALENRDLKLARLQAERLSAGEKRNALLAQISELEAQEKRREEELAAARERIRTERDRAEQLVEYLVGDLHRQLRRIGRLDILAGICEKALEHFEQAQTMEEDEGVAVSRVRAYLNIADVHQARGALDAAEQALSKVINLVQNQMAQRSQSKLWAFFHSQAWRRLGENAYHRGDYVRAKAAFECGYEALRSVRQGEDNAPEHDFELARLLHGLGLVLWRQGQREAALSYHIEAETLAARLCRLKPDNADYASARAAILASLGNVYRDLGDFANAVAVSQESLRLRELLHRLDPGDLTRLGDLLWIRNNLGLIYLIQGEHEKAKKLFLANRDSARQLIQNDPDNLQNVRDLGFAVSLAGEIAYMQNDLAAARELLGEAYIVAEEILGREPQSLYARCGAARTRAQVGEVLLALGQTGEALAHLRTATQRAAEILELAPQNPTAIKTWSRCVLLRLLVGDFVGSDSEAMLAKVENYLAQLTATSDELDRLDNEAALALARGDHRKASMLMQTLKARKWLAPALAKCALSHGIELREDSLAS
jgi:serine/threonine protein kinase